MQVFCTDGTVFPCRSYQLTEQGVKLYEQPLDPDDERYSGDPEQVGFVPHERLLYILPDNITPAAPTTGRGRPLPSGSTTGGQTGRGLPTDQSQFR